MAESRATDMIGEIAERGCRPGRVRRFFQTVKRNLFPREPLPGLHRPVRDDTNPVPPGLDRRARLQMVTLPRHQVTMLRQGFEEMLKWAISERDCYFNSITTHGGHVPDPEDRLTLADMDDEIELAQYTLRQFDKVFHA